MVLSEPLPHAGGFLLSEANGSRSRSVETLASGQDLGAGTVLGRITAGGNMTQFDQDAGDGSEAAAGILFAPVDATGGDTDCVAIVRDAEVKADSLIWPDDIDPGEKDAAIAELEALGIIVR